MSTAQQSVRELQSNGLRIFPLPVPGTSALSVLLAFDAGARCERAEENGIAHFLEHLVFKGGERYGTHQAINRTAEGMGGVLNAYTSQDLVAFHITVRAQSAIGAIDLLSDFVGRPRIAAEDLERERGVVIQEINRANDQPAVIAENLIDQAAFGEHPLGRTVLGPVEHIASFSRDQVIAFRQRRWSGRRGGAFLAGNLEHLPAPEQLDELLGRLPDLPLSEPFPPAPAPRFEKLVCERDTNQSHLRLIYRSAQPPGTRAERAAAAVFATILGGSMSSRLFEELRERRGLCYSVYALAHSYADVPILQIGSGLKSEQCIEAYALIRQIVSELADQGPSEEEVARARAYTAGRLALAFENSSAMARGAAEEVIVHGEEPDPEAMIAAVDAVDAHALRAIGSSLILEPAVACVGPHSASDF
ncbi:MAG TPA: pitrilysin family protein [Solirubrobacteraceae bacterium]|nr:pitrilysin family protein [Solirubrobacteraceae bacterium]